MDNIISKKRNWTRVLKMVIPYILIIGLFQYAAFLILGLDVTKDILPKSTWEMFLITLFVSVGTFLTIWLFRKYIDKEPVPDLGLKEIKKKDILYGLIIGFAIMLLGFLVLVFNNEIKYSDSVLLIPDFIMSIGIFGLVAFNEELLIRGYVLSNLMDSMNRYYALIISSLLFSIMHTANPSYGWFPALELFLSGIVLGLSYIYTRNLWFPIALHFSWNFFQGTIFGFNVSGMDDYSVIRHTREHNTIWNGGAFGFEGSVLSVIFQIICIYVIYTLFSKKTDYKSKANSEKHANTF